MEQKDIVEKVLKASPQDIEFEPIPEENTSPLAQKVAQKPLLETDRVEVHSEPSSSNIQNEAKNNPVDDKIQAERTNTRQEPSDAPEQDFNGNADIHSANGAEETVPVAEATLMADTILGVVNNTVLEVGAGYFVTIRKHKDFYEFEELVQIIDEQNVKNIRRIKLDDEDKALIRPLLIHVLRKKAKVLTPEQQLLGVALSIIIKKAKLVMEIRNENEKLEDKILDMIRREVRKPKEEDWQHQGKHENEAFNMEKQGEDPSGETIYEEVVTNPDYNPTGLPKEVLETAD